MNNTLKIVKAKVKHVNEIVEIENQCFNIPWTYKTFEGEITNNPNAIFLVAKSGKKVIGYVGMWKILNEGHILNLAVHEKFRKNGIATLLLDKLEKVCKRKNIDCLTLEVRKSNTGAINLYSKNGFIKSGLRKKYYANNHEDAIIMWKLNLR
jgi:ribosomal-protein-alanine N-acetyltransferase